MMKALFICNQGMHRSRTAAHIFKNRFETMHAGLFSWEPVTKKQLEWADTIFVMEEFQREELAKRFPDVYMQKRILCLDVPDVYHYCQPELIELLKQRMDKLS